MKKTPGAERQLNSAHNKASVNLAHEALARLKLPPPELQELAAYFDDLGARNLQAALGVRKEGHRIKSVLGAKRVAAFISRNGFTDESFALQVGIDVKTLRSLLKHKKTTATIWAVIASEMNLTPPQLLDL